MKDPFVRRLCALAEKDPSIMVLTADLGFGMFEPFSTRFPRQFCNVGVAEQNMIGLATGLALEGRIVFTYSIGNFGTLRCLEQIRNDASYHGANVKVVSVGAGFSYGALGFSHHATEDLAILRATPGVTVVSPGDEWETEEATEAVAYHPGTCFLRIDKSSSGMKPRPEEKFRLSQNRLLKEGNQVTLIPTGGGMVKVALEAAAQLDKEGISTRVLEVHTIEPLETESIIQAAKETSVVFTLEEHVIRGGLGGAVAEALLESGVTPRKFHRVGLRSGFSTLVGDQNYLRQKYGMDESAVIRLVQSALS